MSGHDPLRFDAAAELVLNGQDEAETSFVFAPVDRATLQTQVYEQLRRAVMGGVFRPGTPITIRAAADALGVSQMPARAALQRLEIEGALVARGGKRTLVIPEMSREEYTEMLDIGVMLEGMAAERACGLITPDEVAIMTSACHAMQAAADSDDRDAYVVANWTFHRTLYAASRLKTLLGFIEMRWLRIGPYVRLMMPDRESLLTSMPNHWAVLEALRARDGVAARNAITSDLQDCARTLLPYL